MVTSATKTPLDLEYATRSVPRYTSYPTAPHFDASVGRDVYRGWLAGLDGERVVLVGHEPHLSSVISWFLSGSAGRSLLVLKKSQAVLLSTKKAAPGGAALVWSLPPRVLRKLA